MIDRPPATRGARIFGQAAAIIVLGGGLLLVLLAIIRIAIHIIEGF